MPEITDEQLLEYEKLRKWAKRENVLKSAREIKKLEDDIDLPVKNCVGMFALLGCKPIYSCCGFDYEGQPIHKSHQYGRPYFMLTTTKETMDVLYAISKRKSPWIAQKNTEPIVNLEILANMNPHWRQHECIHFAEECVIGITWIERLLWSAKKYMKEEVVLEDTNNMAKKDIPYWQYPPKEPWIVRLSDIEASFTKK